MIDKGAVIAGITDGYAGSAPDIGAYERGGSEKPGLRDSAGPSRIEVRAGAGVAAFRLAQNFPNPFNPATTISFTLPRAGRAMLEVYSAAGRKIATVTDRWLETGDYSVPFHGQGLPSGVYLCRLSCGGLERTQRMMLVR